MQGHGEKSVSETPPAASAQATATSRTSERDVASENFSFEYRFADMRAFAFRLERENVDLVSALEGVIGQVMQAKDGFGIWPYAGSSMESVVASAEILIAVHRKGTGS